MYDTLNVAAKCVVRNVYFRLIFTIPTGALFKVYSVPSACVFPDPTI